MITSHSCASEIEVGRSGQHEKSRSTVLDGPRRGFNQYENSRSAVLDGPRKGVKARVSRLAVGRTGREDIIASTALTLFKLLIH